MPLSPDHLRAGCADGATPAARRVGASALAALLSLAVSTASATPATSAASAAPGTSATPAAAADTSVTAAVDADRGGAASGPSVELNRLEDAGGGCRLTLVVANPGAQRFEQLKLDLVLFDGDGIVARRLAVETGPVRANKTVVRLFEAADLPCAGIGRLLLNDVVTCTGEDGAIPGCVDRLATASRTAVPFER